MRFAAAFVLLLAGCEGVDTHADGGPDAAGDLGADSQPADAQAAPLPPRIVVAIGDSITAGQKVPGSYRTALWARGGVDFVGREHSGPDGTDRDHEGRGGFTCGDIHDQVAPWLRTLARKPDVGVLHVGTNDFLRGAGFAQLDAAFPRMLAAFRAASPGTRWIAVTLSIHWPKWRAEAERWNDRLIEIGPSLGVEVVDVRLPAAEVPDNVHPNAAGFQRLAAAIGSAL